MKQTLIPSPGQTLRRSAFGRRWPLLMSLLAVSLPLTSGCGRADRAAGRQPGVASDGVITGTVTADGQALAEARVRLKGHAPYVLTDERGRFELPLNVAAKGSSLTVTAAKPGFVIAGQKMTDGMQIQLEPVPDNDNEAYQWIDPTPDPTASLNCGNCHAEIYNQWKSGGHASAADNRHFLNLYAGTNWHGHPSKGWGLLTEYAEGAGVCIACHAPAARIDQLGVADIRSVDEVARQGVHCDYCHKVQDVNINALGLTHGRFASELLRPSEGQLFFGPLDDVDRGEDSFLPLQNKSRFCASCHEGIVFGVPVYTTYSEWLESPAKAEGKQCQSCHMRPDNEMTNFAPGVGGIQRDPMTLASHRLLPGGRLAMLRSCLSVTPTADRDDEAVRVNVRLVAENVGHRVPTGFIDRHLILIVQAFDDRGELLNADGPKLPTAAGGLAHQSGVLFAKLLTDETGHSPVPFWRAGATVRDTRLRPQVAENYEFKLPTHATRLRIRLLYRRFWHETSQLKEWPDETLNVFDRTWPLADLL